MTMRPDMGASHAATIGTLQNIIDYIEKNLLEPLTPALIAGHFFLSVSSVNGLFKVVCDIAVMEYIRNRRLALAGRELMKSDIRIIDLAYKYGYETPEAFAKAFTRFHGFPPGFVRRVYPEVKAFHPLKINVEIQGGWGKTASANAPIGKTEMKLPGQDRYRGDGYNGLIKYEGGIAMKTGMQTQRISTKAMEHKEDWKTLLTLAQTLDGEGIAFKVDGKTMIFAHGLEFKLEKICLTFKWNDEQRILDFFNHGGKADRSFHQGFKYFDAMFGGMNVRCMFYGDCPGDDTDDFLFRNTDLVNVDGQTLHVQTLEFYIENAEPEDETYRMVELWMKSRD